MKMLRKPVQLTLLLIAVICILNSGSANAQERIRAGQTVNGVLEASDYAPDEWQIEDHYLYEGQEGEKIKITLTKKSDNFTGYYMVGIFEISPRRRFYDVNLRPQQDGIITLPTGGVWGIAVTSMKTGHGLYTLLVEQVSLPTTPSKQYPEIRAGEIRVGSLNEKSQKYGNNKQFEQWAYKGRKGERIRIMINAIGSYSSFPIFSLSKRGASAVSNTVLIKLVPFVPTTDMYLNESSNIFILNDIMTDVHDAMLDEDTTYLITLSNEKFMEYKVRVESFGVFDARAQLPVDVSSVYWKQLGSNDDGSIFIDVGKTRLVAGEGSYKLYRARVRFDYKKAKDFAGVKSDRLIAAIEVACGQRQFSMLSLLAYSGDKLILGSWTLDDWTGFSQEQFGGLVINHVCQQK